MIVFVSTRSHRYTHHYVAKNLPAFRRVSYPEIFTWRSFPHATYIFTDFDRLGFWQLECAAHIYRGLQSGGCRVLNDPGRALQRLPLLRRLYRLGINHFQAWPADEVDVVDRFPVFLRTASAHRGVLTDLVQTRDALAHELERLLRIGYPVSDLVIVQYRAEPFHGDIFRKLSAYRIGTLMVPALSVHERKWTAKQGEPGIADEAAYLEDLQQVRDNSFGEVARVVFEAACVDYGRVDFGIVAGRPEFYEINTNPVIGQVKSHPFSSRVEADRISRERYKAAMVALDDQGDGGVIKISTPTMVPWRARRIPGYQWVP